MSALPLDRAIVLRIQELDAAGFGSSFLAEHAEEDEDRELRQLLSTHTAELCRLALKSMPARAPQAPWEPKHREKVVLYPLTDAQGRIREHRDLIGEMPIVRRSQKADPCIMAIGAVAIFTRRENGEWHGMANGNQYQIERKEGRRKL